jgi:hypothetical protein
MMQFLRELIQTKKILFLILLVFLLIGLFVFVLLQAGIIKLGKGALVTPAPFPEPVPDSVWFYEITEQSPIFTVISAGKNSSSLELSFALPRNYQGDAVTSKVACKTEEIQVVRTRTLSSDEQQKYNEAVNKLSKELNQQALSEQELEKRFSQGFKEINNQFGISEESISLEELFNIISNEIANNNLSNLLFSGACSDESCSSIASQCRLYISY